MLDNLCSGEGIFNLFENNTSAVIKLTLPCKFRTFGAAKEMYYPLGSNVCYSS